MDRSKLLRLIQQMKRPEIELFQAFTSQDKSVVQKSFESSQILHWVPFANISLVRLNLKKVDQWQQRDQRFQKIDQSSAYFSWGMERIGAGTNCCSNVD